MRGLKLQHRITDSKRGVTLEIFSNRKLNKEELALTQREAFKGKAQKLKRGTVVKLYSLFN